MSETEAASATPPLTLRQFLLRVLGMVALIAAVIASGIAIYRNQREVAGLPVVFVPRPRETHSPTVEDVITRNVREVAAAPDDADAWRVLGWSYFQRGQYAQCVDALRHATRLDPTSARTFSFLGEALLQVSKPQRRVPREARRAFERALALDPKDARARYYRAVGWDLAGQHRRAINAWFSLLKDTPADAPYAGDIRAVIRTVGARHHIRVEKRLAAVQAAATAPTTAPAQKPRETLPGPVGASMRAAEGVPRPAASASSAAHDQ